MAGTGALPLDDSSILKYEDEEDSSRDESGFTSFMIDELNEKPASRMQGISVMNENL